MKYALALAMAALAVVFYLGWRRRARARFVREFVLPKGVLERFRLKHPGLTPGQAALVVEGLRQYFEICAAAGMRFASMPSQVVDDLWHEFILFTRNYQHFCQRAFGRYLHHTPAEAMSPGAPQAGIRRAWKQACRLEGIKPDAPDRLPLLFALDAQLGIANGFVYALNCRAPGVSPTGAYCAGDIGSCGGGDGGSCGDSDGGGDSGCGGGGCGGGD